MRLTFPRFGDTHIAAKLFFQGIGVDVVLPGANAKRILDCGAAVSPEEICLPFKLMVGNLLDAYERGADTVIMPATAGPCRLGEYAELLRSVLDKAGKKFDWIVIESPAQIGIKEFLFRVQKATGGVSVSMSRALFLGKEAERLVREIENLKALAHEKAGRATDPNECHGILRGCMTELEKVETLADAFCTLSRWRKRLRKMHVDSGHKPIRVLVTGEIYTLIETYANHDIEEKLMKMGVSFFKRVTVSWWIRHTIKETALGGPLRFLRAWRSSRHRHLPYNIGGYARETVAEGLICKQQGYDGIIQIFPSGCMPEIVAKSVLTEMAAQSDIRVLCLIFDEMDGDAGYMTRLEAFVDMLERRRKCIV